MSETSQKFNIKQTFLIGLAFFSSEVAWALYNAQVPLLLANYLPSLFMIGLLMALIILLESFYNQ